MVKTADQHFVRSYNTALVLDLVRKQAPLSRAAISSQTGLNRSTVSSIVQELIDSAFLIETELQGEKVGRPGILLNLNPKGGAFIAVELNVGFASGIVVNLAGDPIGKRFISINPAAEKQIVLEQIKDLIRKLIQQAGQRELPLMGLGLGLPGVVDPERGELVYAPNLHWEHVPIKQIFEEEFHLPVRIDNEANCAVLGEFRFGVGQGINEIIYLSANAGLGGGILINGKLFRGSHGFASEIGHSVLDPNGKLCSCGRYGCWETLVGTDFLVKQTVNRLRSQPSKLSEVLKQKGDLSFDDLLAAANANIPLALEIFTEAGVNLGRGVTNLVNIFNPRLVVLGGLLSQVAWILLPQMEKVVFDESLDAMRKDLALEASALGQEACLLGAVSLIYDEVIRDPIAWKNKLI